MNNPTIDPPWRVTKGTDEDGETIYCVGNKGIFVCQTYSEEVAKYICYCVSVTEASKFDV